MCRKLTLAATALIAISIAPLVHAADATLAQGPAQTMTPTMTSGDHSDGRRTARAPVAKRPAPSGT